MAGILNLLFDEYTRSLFAKQMKTESQSALTCFQQLRELVGEEMAIDIWDTAVGEGAVMQEECFQAGMKVGIAFVLEILSL